MEVWRAIAHCWAPWGSLVGCRSGWDPAVTVALLWGALEEEIKKHRVLWARGQLGGTASCTGRSWGLKLVACVCGMAPLLPVALHSAPGPGARYKYWTIVFVPLLFLAVEDMIKWAAQSLGYGMFAGYASGPANGCSAARSNMVAWYSGIKVGEGCSMYGATSAAVAGPVQPPIQAAAQLVPWALAPVQAVAAQPFPWASVHVVP